MEASRRLDTRPREQYALNAMATTTMGTNVHARTVKLYHLELKASKKSQLGRHHCHHGKERESGNQARSQPFPGSLLKVTEKTA